MNSRFGFLVGRVASTTRVMAAAASLCAGIQAQTVWFVNTSGAGTGGSWGSPTTLSKALSLAATGDEIRCTEGVYNPVVRTDPSDPRSVTFSIPRGVLLRGGYLGSETTGRPLGNVVGSMLDGDIGVVTDPSDDAYHVVTVSATQPVTISRFKIEKGNASPAIVVTPANETRNKGGGIYAPLGAQLVLSSLWMQDNNADDRGGAFYLSNGSALVKQCTLELNGAVRGAGIYSGFSQLDAVNVRFNLNGGAGRGIDGGALYLRANSSTFTNCIFEENFVEVSGGRGGAAFLIGGHSTLMTNCTFNNNRSWAGAVQTLDNASNLSGFVTLQNSIVWSDWLPAGTTQFSGDALPPASNLNFGVQYSDVLMPAGYPPGSLYPDSINPVNTNFNIEPIFNLPILSLRFDPLFPTWPSSSTLFDAGLTALLPADFADVDNDGNTAEQLPRDRELFTRVQGAAVAIGAIEQANLSNYVMP